MDDTMEPLAAPQTESTVKDSSDESPNVVSFERLPKPNKPVYYSSHPLVMSGSLVKRAEPNSELPAQYVDVLVEPDEPDESIVVIDGKPKRLAYLPSPLVVAKVYHALLYIAQLRDWQTNSKGQFEISFGDLHRMTNKTCSEWMQYVDTLEWIWRNVTLEWGHLSRVYKDIRYIGKTSIIESGPYAALKRDKNGKSYQLSHLIVSFPKQLLEDIIKPQLFGQIDPNVLFKLRSAHALQAYLLIGDFLPSRINQLAEIGKTFFSFAYSVAEWKDLLGVDRSKYSAKNFTTVFLARVAKQINNATSKTSVPMEVHFIRTDTGRYQMCVKLVASKLVSAKKTTIPDCLSEADREGFWTYLREMSANWESPLPEAEKWDDSRMPNQELMRQLFGEWRHSAETQLSMDLE